MWGLWDFGGGNEYPVSPENERMCPDFLNGGVDVFPTVLFPSPFEIGGYSFVFSGSHP